MTMTVIIVEPKPRSVRHSDTSTIQYSGNAIVPLYRLPYSGLGKQIMIVLHRAPALQFVCFPTIYAIEAQGKLPRLSLSVSALQYALLVRFHLLVRL